MSKTPNTYDVICEALRLAPDYDCLWKLSCALEEKGKEADLPALAVAFIARQAIYQSGQKDFLYNATWFVVLSGHAHIVAEAFPPAEKQSI
mgnify:CR=1 FL=1